MNPCKTTDTGILRGEHGGVGIRLLLYCGDRCGRGFVHLLVS